MSGAAGLHGHRWRDLKELDTLDTAGGATTVAFITLKETIKTPRALSPSLFKAGSKGPTLIHFLMKRRMFVSPLDDPTARTRPLCPQENIRAVRDSATNGRTSRTALFVGRSIGCRGRQRIQTPPATALTRSRTRPQSSTRQGQQGSASSRRRYRRGSSAGWCGPRSGGRWPRSSRRPPRRNARPGRR